MGFEVRKNTGRSRYELFVDGDLAAIADYRMDGERVVMPHTEVDGRRRGQGLGAVLVRGALEDVRASGARVEPQCWYVASFIDDHPEFSDLVAS
ncbi:MAG TPA: GNAT family N-acetyltransferase [Acidimicrobiales bacterium]|nr:GNAT family N-acetyltransferase [Acidimicrobiales bacterium]